jgi:Rieske 2Fe-2S family protein
MLNRALRPDAREIPEEAKMKADADSTMTPGRFTLPARYYIDPDHFRRELDRVFGRIWFAAGRVDEVPEVGDYVLKQVGDESLIVVRESADRINAFYNVCRHRGTQVCEAPSGHAKRLQCQYHAWTYGLDGRLVAAPHFDEGEAFRKADWGLKAAGCGVWDGHIFLNLDPAAPPLLDQLDDLSARFAAWRMGELRRGARVVYDVAANWKLIIQNYSECLHCPVIHPALAKVSHYMSGQNEPGGPDSSYLGGRMDLNPGVVTMSFDGKARREYLPGLDAQACRHVYYYAVLPNLLLSVHPDYVMTHVLWPRAADRTEIICEWHFHPEEMARPGFDPSDAVEFWDLTNRQDWHVSELTQLGLKSRAYSPGPYSIREELLHDFDRWIVARDTEEG